MKILVINGPNLNMLGKRNPAIYGSGTYDDLCALIKSFGDERGMTVEFFQSNSEGDIISRIQKCLFDETEGLIINAGAYTHYSYAIRDALEMLKIPKIEVHISDVDAREDFRKISVIRDVCTCCIKNEGFDGYVHALKILEESEKNS